MARPIPMMSADQRTRFWDKVLVGHDESCWVWQGPRSTGRYGLFRIGATKYLPNRISWAEHFGQIPPGQCVCHRCDNPRCVNPRHLFLGTHGDNMADMVAKGRRRSNPARGEAASGAKLTEADARRIREDDRPQRVIASEYGVNQSTVSDIKRRVLWAHL